MPIGLDCKLYYNSATYGSPTWVLIPQARDVTIADSRETGDSSSREYTTKSTVVGQRVFEISFDAVMHRSAAAYTGLETAYLARTILGIAAMDAAITTVGTKGTRADIVITKFERSEPMNDSVKVSITMAACVDNGHEPELFTAS